MTDRTWKQNLLAASGIGISLLPKIACPACWPAYAGPLSSIGLSFLVPNLMYLLPLTVVFLIIAVGMLAIRVRHRRGYAPFALGVIARPHPVRQNFLWLPIQSSTSDWGCSFLALSGTVGP